MTPLLWSLGMAAALGFAPPPAGEKPTTIDVWPGKPPGDTADLGPEKVEEPKPGDKFPVTRVTNVSRPTLAVYRPAKDLDTGAAVVIAPGGGYAILAWDLEGEEVAQWLTSVGVTGIVLKYRVPRRPGSPPGPPPQAEMDAQRAISLVRGKAKEWGIDPKRIGMLGFSAGGDLTAWTSTNSDKRSYEPVDDADKQSCRPDFTILIYPAYLTTKEGVMAPEIRVTKEAPPTFIAVAADDKLCVDGAVELFSALHKAGVPAALHVFESGGHGFGLRPSDKPCSTWPRLCADWMRAQGLLQKAAP